MADSVARHLQRYLGAGFWLTVVAAALNGLYWRLPVPPLWQRIGAVGTAVVALAALGINARALRADAVAGGRLGRRVTWLLQVTAVVVMATVVRFLWAGR